MAEPWWGSVSAEFKESVVGLIAAHTKEMMELRGTHANRISEISNACISADVLQWARSPEKTLPRLVSFSEEDGSLPSQEKPILPYIGLPSQDMPSLSLQEQSFRRQNPPLELASWPGSSSASWPRQSMARIDCRRQNSPPKRGSGRVSHQNSLATCTSEDTCSSPRTFRKQNEKHWDKSISFGQKDVAATVWETTSERKAKGCINRIVRSTGFEVVFAVLIALHAIYTGVQTEYKEENDNISFVFQALDYTFGVAFTVEMAMRIIAKGCYAYLWASKDWAWNYLDILVVTLSWTEALIQITATLAQGDDNVISVTPLRMLRMIRFARVARALRIGRVFRMVRSFHFLVVAILHSLQAVFWSSIIILILIYIFALVLREAASEIEESGGAHPDFDMYWGSLGSAMFTLFKAIAGGLSWHDCVVPLATLSGIWTAVFILYICFATFAVFNVMTGVFCKSAIEGAQSDREFAVQKHMEMRKIHEETAKQLFKEIDSDDSSRITLHEFEAHWNSPEARAFFSSLEIESDQAWELFRLLDKDAEGFIDTEDFVYGCLHLNGTATAISAANLTMMTTGIDSRLARVRFDQKKQWTEVKRQAQVLKSLDSQLFTILSSISRLHNKGSDSRCPAELLKQLGPQNPHKMSL